MIEDELALANEGFVMSLDAILEDGYDVDENRVLVPDEDEEEPDQ